MSDQIIATFGFIGLVFGLVAGLRIALRACLIARLMIEDLCAPRQARPGIANDHALPAEPRSAQLPLAALSADIATADAKPTTGFVVIRSPS